MCGNLFSENPNNVILFGFFQDISFSGYYRLSNEEKPTVIKVNNAVVKPKFIVSKKEGNKNHFFVSIPSGIIPGETNYLIELNHGENSVSFKITMAGPMPDNLEEKELNFYLKNQIWYYHQLVTEKNKRVFALENSLSWKITSPLRLFFDIISKLPLLFSKDGIKVLKSILSLNYSKSDLNQKLTKVLSTDNSTAIYQHFLSRKAWEEPTESEILKFTQGFKHKTLISIITPVYNCPKVYLEAAVESVKAQ